MIKIRHYCIATLVRSITTKLITIELISRKNRCDCNKRIKRELSLPFYIIANLLLYGINNALLVDRISSSSLLWFPIGVCSSSCYVRLRNLILSRRKSELSASYPGALGVLSVFAFLEKCLWVSCELFCGGRIIVRICFCKCFGWFSYWFLDFHMRDKGNEKFKYCKKFQWIRWENMWILWTMMNLSLRKFFHIHSGSSR